MAGVLIAGYWVLNRSNLDPADPYQAGGRYWFREAEPAGVLATVIGAVLAVGGAYSAPGPGTIP